jgi:ClpP class serine protease
VQEQERLKLIREIEDKRGSRVISYITVDRPGFDYSWGAVVLEDVRAIERHIRLCLARHAKKIDLFLHTPGGLVIVPWALVSLFREYLGHRAFNVLIASRAFSAGTKIALGADEIVMAAGANLGPVDSQLGGGLGVEDLRNYFTMAETLGLGSVRDRRDHFKILSQTTHPVVIGAINRVWTEGERAVMVLLGSRRRALSERANRAIADFLLKRIGIHGQSIRRTEARQIGISFVKDAEEFGIQSTLAQLFDAYEALLDIDVPYPDAALNHDFEVPIDPTVPVALIESVDRLDIAYGDPYRAWRQSKVAAPGEAPREPMRVAEGAQFGVKWKALRAPPER